MAKYKHYDYSQDVLIPMKIRDTRPIFVLDFWNDGPYVDGCIAGARTYFHVNVKGEVEPCVYTHISVDNIKEKSLKEACDPANRRPLYASRGGRNLYHP